MGAGMKVTLSPRQKEILELLRDGYAAKEIANKLGISHLTVRNIMAVTREKLGAVNTTQAVVVAIRSGCIDLGTEMITIEQFYNHKLWEEFSQSCPFRVPYGYHYPEDKPDGACNYVDPKTGGGVYANCCFTSCMAWLDKLSELDRADVLAEMEEGYREMIRLDPSYHK